MGVDLETAVGALERDPIADLGGLLKGNGRAELTATLERLRAAGRPARVVLAPKDEPLGPLHALWDRLHLNRDRDLLLLFNGRRWEARGWGLSDAAIQRALVSAEPGLRRYYARGLSDALGALAAAAAAPGAAPSTRSSSAGTWIVGTGAVATVGVLGFLIARRNKRARERARTLTEARSAAEKVFSEVMLASEDLPDPEAGPLRDKAARLKQELDALAPAHKALPPKEEKLTFARMGQLEDELEALRSVVLQQTRKR